MKRPALDAKQSRWQEADGRKREPARPCSRRSGKRCSRWHSGLRTAGFGAVATTLQRKGEPAAPVATRTQQLASAHLVARPVHPPGLEHPGQAHHRATAGGRLPLWGVRQQLISSAAFAIARHGNQEQPDKKRLMPCTSRLSQMREHIAAIYIDEGSLVLAS
jgi:hypothetical protein